MTYAISTVGIPSYFEHHRDHDVDRAIQQRVDGLIEQVLWYLKEEGALDLDRVMEILSECSHEDTAAIGLTLEQKVEAIEEGMDEYGDSDLSLTFQSLRSELESYAAYFINLMAEGKARQIFDELYDFMLDNELEPDQMREDNGFGWLPHRSEREEGDCVIYEYRNVEDPGHHIDLWQYPLADGWRVYFVVPVDGD